MKRASGTVSKQSFASILDQHDFQEWIEGVCWAVSMAYRRCDWRTMHRIAVCLRTLHRAVREEPRLSLLDSCVAHCMLQTAQASLDHLEFRDCLQLCRLVRQRLSRKAARRARLKLPYRPDTLRKVTLYTRIAGAKWLGPAELRDEAMAPREIIDGYFDAEKRVRDYLLTHPRPADEEKRILDNTAWCWLAVTKMALRYERERAEELMDFSELYYKEAATRSTHPFMWDLYIAQLWLAQKLTRSEYQRASVRRRTALRRVKGAEFDLTAYDLCTAREMNYMLRMQRPELRVVGSA